MEARVKTGIFVSAALRMGAACGKYGAVLRKGDADSGGVLAVLRGREGVLVLSQTRAPDGQLAWMRATGATPVSDEVADAYVARAAARDPDIWVIEFEAHDYVPPFEGRIL
jgi:hypothetical protein